MLQDKNMRFGDYIRKKRLEDPRELTMSDVSKQLGISLSLLSEIEHKRRMPFDAAKIEIFAAFLTAFNQRITNRAEIFAAYDEVLAALTDTAALDTEAAALTQECEIVMELTRKAVLENASAAQDQAAYQERYDALVARYDAAHARLGEIEAARTEHRAKRANINRFLRTLARQESLITEFDEELWYTTVDRVTVFEDRRLAVLFRDGAAVEIREEQWKALAA